MAEKKVLVDLNLNKNELKQTVIENQGLAPSSPKDGQIYYNTASGSKGINVYKTNAWKRLLDEDDTSNFVPTSRKVNNKALTADITLYGTDVAMSSTDSTTVKSAIDGKQATITGGATTITSSNLTASKALISNSSGKVAVSDTTSTELGYVHGVTSAIQTQLDNKVPKPATALTAATKTVITYDANGLVTGGSEIAIDSGSSNYLAFNTSTHKISAKVDTTVTDSSSKLITSGAVASAIQSAVVGGVIYQGTWNITSASDFSGITLPVKKGYLYYVIGTGPKTIGGIEWNAGDYLLVNENVAAGGSLTGKVEKIDNTESADIVRTSATQTLTNKTIDADDNTISDLTTSNLKSGVLQTTVRASSSATDTTIASEKAIRTELDKKANLASPVFTGTPTAPTATAGTNNTQIATTAFVNNAIASASLTIAENNPALTQSGGVCTWTITNTLNNADVICSIREVSSGEEVETNKTYTASNIVIKMNSATNIAAGTYRAVVIGQKVSS